MTTQTHIEGYPSNDVIIKCPNCYSLSNELKIINMYDNPENVFGVRLQTVRVCCNCKTEFNIC